jgi:hypothetical protein
MIELTRKIIAAEMELVISRIQANIRNKKVTRFGSMNASGRTAASLHYEIDDKEVRLYGAKHVFALEFGRGPTQNSGPGTLKDRIRVWIDEKGITPKPGLNGKAISKDSLAYLITRKLHREGSTLFKQGGNSGILKDVINSELENNLRKALFAEFEMIVTQQLLNAE